MSNVEVQIEDYLHEWLDVEYVTAPVGHTSYGLEYEIRSFKVNPATWKHDLDTFLSKYDSINKVLLYTIEYISSRDAKTLEPVEFIKIRLEIDGVLNATT